MRTLMPSKWFRMYAEFATDPKVQMLSEQDQRRYMMLLCLRCGNGDVTLHETEVAFQLRISDDEWARTKAVLLAKKLIDESNKPTAWEKRQYASDSSAERVAKHRALNKKASNSDVTLQKRPVEAEAEAEINPRETIVSLVANDVGNKSDKVPDCPQQQIVELFGELLPELPQPRAWEGQRANNLKVRWRWVLTAKRKGGERYATDTQSGIEFFRRMFGYVRESDFLMGRGKAGWLGCDLGWLVKAENFEKVLAGNYENKEATA